LKHYFLRT